MMKAFTHRRLLSAAIALVVIFAASAVTTPAADAAAVPDSMRADAKAMLDSGRLGFANTEPQRQIEAYAAGLRRINPRTGRPCNLDSILLRALKRTVVDEGLTIRISSLNRWCEGIEAANWYNFHSVNGGGHAVDVMSVNGVTSTGGTPQDLLYIAAMVRALPTPAGLGQMNCAQNVTLPVGWVRFPDSCDHVHVEFRGVDPLAPPPPPKVVPRDYTGDGMADIVAIRRDGAMIMYRGDGKGGLGSGGIGTQIGSGWQGMTAVAGGADYDGDGTVDIYARRSDGVLFFYRGTGAGAVRDGLSIGQGWQGMTQIIAGGDYDGDGDADILAIDGPGSLYLYPGTGEGTLAEGTRIGWGWSGFTRVIGGGDFDGDGRADLYGIDAAGNLWFYRGTGPGMFADGVQRGWGWTAMSLVSTAGDLDRDGRADLLARDPAGRLIRYPAIGDGYFGTGLPFGSGWDSFRILP
jgi:hypothetical protein